MVIIEINGVALDLSSDFKVQLKKQNIIFEFDTIECERTTSFVAPNTQNNAAVFMSSGNFATYGEAMRRKYNAQMRVGVVSKQGVLFVESYNASGWNCVFVCGLYNGLQAIRDAGSIADNIRPSRGITFYEGAEPSNDITAFDDCKCVDYVSNLVDKALAYSFGNAVKYAVESTGVKVELPAEVWKYWAVKGQPKGKREGVSFFASAARSIADENANSISVPLYFNSYSTTAIKRVGFRWWKDYEKRYTGVAYVQEFYALQDLTLFFPDDFPADVFLVDLPSNDIEDDEKCGALGLPVFYGDYSLEFVRESDREWPHLEPKGEPLAGRSVEMKRGRNFFFMKRADYVYEYKNGINDPVRGYRYCYLNDLQQSANRPESRAGLSFVYSIITKGKDDLKFGSFTTMYDQVADVSILDACKQLAALRGEVLMYDNVQGLTFDALADWGEWQRLDVSDRLIRVKELTRKVGDYKQHNVVKFDSNDYVINHLQTDYTIDNDNLEREKVLLTLPFSEGGGTDDVYIKGEQKNDDKEGVFGFVITTGKNDTLVVVGDGTGQYANRIELQKNAFIERVCQSSTTLKIEVVLSLVEFEQLKDKTLIYMRGGLFAWKNAEYNNGVVTIEIIKI